mgnify:CR=1 FL=1
MLSRGLAYPEYQVTQLGFLGSEREIVLIIDTGHHLLDRQLSYSWASTYLTYVDDVR